jgi:hypothetical protein
MAEQYLVSTGSVALTSGTAKTVIELPTGSTAPLTIVLMEFMTSSTSAATLIVEVGTYTVSGTGTTITPQKWGTDQSVAANVGTVKIADSSEPSSFTVGTLPNWIISLPGMYSIIYPFGRELYWPISTLRAFRLTASASINARVNIVFEQ